MELEVSPEGGQPYTLRYRTVVGMTHWPEPDQVVPVTIDRGHRNRLRIEWSEVKPHRVAVGVSPEAIQPAPPPPAPEPPPAPLPAAARAAGAADGRAGRRRGAPRAARRPRPRARPGRGPRAGRARARAAPARRGGRRRPHRPARAPGKLHEAGILTDAELASEKRRILDG
ncbi:MAG: hypothetical protein R3C15_14590 [Thermoleophilia bacterium]